MCPLSITLAAVITSNTSLATLAGNMFVPAAASGLDKDSVINITALVTLDKTDIDSPVGHCPTASWTTSTAGCASLAWRRVNPRFTSTLTVPCA